VIYISNEIAVRSGDNNGKLFVQRQVDAETIEASETDQLVIIDLIALTDHLTTKLLEY
jgi:hypothetical protein